MRALKSTKPGLNPQASSSSIITANNIVKSPKNSNSGQSSRSGGLSTQDKEWFLQRQTSNATLNLAQINSVGSSLEQSPTEAKPQRRRKDIGGHEKINRSSAKKETKKDESLRLAMNMEFKSYANNLEKGEETTRL